jgi:hypothetical protein
VTTTLSARALNRALLARQWLLRRQRVGVVPAVAHLAGLHAQLPTSANVALLARLEGFAPRDLAQALTDQALVRLSFFRGTLHLVTADDALAFHHLFAPVLRRALQGTTRGVDVPADALARETARLLAEQPRGPKELGEALAARWPTHAAQALSALARSHLPLLQVPPRGAWGVSAAPRLAVMTQWLSRAETPAPVTALLRRYLAAWGPASVADAQAWSGLRGLTAAFAALRSELVTFRDEEGVELFDLEEAPRPHRDEPAPPRLLSDFEGSLLAYADASRFATCRARGGLHRQRAVPPRLHARRLRRWAVACGGRDGAVAAVAPADPRRAGRARA